MGLIAGKFCNQEGNPWLLTTVQLVNVCLIHMTSYVYFELLSGYDLAGARHLQS